MNSALTKKRVFDGKIYLEGIRQLKMVGITATVILTVLSILPPLTSLIDILSYSADKPSVRQASTDNYLLILAYCVVAPLLALVMFRYLNHRNASDFYHALPAPRVCQFMSFFAAALTWVMAAIIISNGVTLIFWVFLSKYFFINLASSLVFMLGIMAASFLVLASVALAMTVTGTGFTNVIVSLLLIFMPRFVTTAFTSAAATSLWIVDNMSLFPLLDGRYNIVTGSVFGSVRFLFRSENPFQYWPGILYTFVLGLIYTAAAVFLYIRRRSESAEKSAPNYFLQSVYRITLAMFLCVFACGGIVSGMLDGYGFSNASYIVLYTLAVLIYFTYELFTTRRIKSLARAVPGLAVLAAINLVFIFGAVGINNALLNDVPALENIGAIRLLPGDPDDYLQNKVQGYKITDPESIEIAHSALEKAVSSIKRDRENRFRGYYYGDPAYDNDKNVYVQLAFETRVRSMNRNVRMSNADLNKIYAALGQEESFRALYTDLPDPDRNTRVDIAGIQNTDMVKQIYEQLRAEAKEIDFADWAGLVSWSSRNEFRKY
ncbi:MAG: hypothetical protein FWE80_07900, partial [Oscillospiraceae bacterium]|nr:hypothetical protein [Oscillospiraceae bacterium]